MKVSASVKRRGTTGFFVRRRGKLFFIDKKNPRNNQRQG